MDLQKFSSEVLNGSELRPIQEKVSEVMGKGNRNLLIVSPTGSGKTEAAYLASKYWKGRTVYGLPMKTLASSIHQRLNSYELNFTGFNWSVQHSSESEDKYLEHDFSVTTIDQILSGYFGFGKESFMRGRNVLRSNLILDEVQLFDPEKALLSTLELLDKTTNEPFNNNFCIMTATFPSYLRTYLSERYDVEIILMEKPVINKEVYLQWKETMPYRSISNYNNKQIIICNRQGQQTEIRDRLLEEGVDPDRLIILNSRFYPSDRKEIEKDVVKYFGKQAEQNNKILVSTQIVEAGMDISADRLYTYAAPMDSLIQREGRCSRWGGKGEFIVVKDKLILPYDEKLTNKTVEIIKENTFKLFSWGNQLRWIDEVFNDYYKKVLKGAKRFRSKLVNGNSQNLIRGVNSLTVIPRDIKEVSTDDFKFEGINVPLSWIKGDVYTKVRDGVKPLKAEIGQIAVISGENWVYDDCGFRIEKGNEAYASIYKNNVYSQIPYSDYIDETVTEHSNLVKEQMVEVLMCDNILPKDEIVSRALYCGAGHDLGKLSSDWQYWIKDGNTRDKTSYAHRPFKPRMKGIDKLKNKRHNILSALMLSEQIDFIDKNVIMAHHGRIYLNDDRNTKVLRTSYVEETNRILKDLGMESIQTLEQPSYVLGKKEIIDPKHKGWAKFVYLTGALMLSDRKAIEENLKNKHLISIDK